MKVVIIGATGTIGKAVVQAFSDRHEIVPVAYSSGEYRVDITSKDSLQQLFQTIAPFDAVICAAGRVKFASLERLTDADFQFSLANKLMGQVNLVRVGLQYIRDQGSFTLTTGVLAYEPMPGGAAISLVNSGLEGFIRAAAIELPRGIRLNAVSPPWVSETLAAMGQDGSRGLPAATIARAYVESVEGHHTGKVIRFSPLTVQDVVLQP